MPAEWRFMRILHVIGKNVKVFFLMARYNESSLGEKIKLDLHVTCQQKCWKVEGEARWSEDGINACNWTSCSSDAEQCSE